jgi:hypothetical protein
MGKPAVMGVVLGRWDGHGHVPTTMATHHDNGNMENISETAENALHINHR